MASRFRDIAVTHMQKKAYLRLFLNISIVSIFLLKVRPMQRYSTISDLSDSYMVDRGSRAAHGGALRILKFLSFALKSTKH